MTALTLLAYISAAILLQVAVGVSIALWRRAHVAVPATPIAPVQRSSERLSWVGWRDFRVARREFEDAARSQCSFYLEPSDGVALPPFKPGQYLTFQLVCGTTDARGVAAPRSVIRCYSLSDKPNASTYRVTIKRATAPPNRPELPPGVSSSFFHDSVKIGDVLSVKAPAGNFYINGDSATQAVFIAGGIGVTPMVSMLQWCLAEQPTRIVHLYYGVRCSADHAFKAQLAGMAASNRNFRLHVVYSNPLSGDVVGTDFQHNGYIDIDLLRRTLPHGNHEFYVCGPSAMMESVVPSIVARGVPMSDVHFEAFGPATLRLPQTPEMVVAKDERVEADIRFARTGRTITWDGSDASLLEFAERNGIPVESGCRSGSCGSCETKLVSGEVRYSHPPDFEVSPGTCLLCVAKPVSALVLEA